MSVKTMLKRKFMDFAKDESGMGPEAGPENCRFRGRVLPAKREILPADRRVPDCISVFVPSGNPVTDSVHAFRSQKKCGLHGSGVRN